MLYYRINNNKLMDWGDYEYSEECLKSNLITKSELDNHPNKVIVKNGELVLNPDFDKEETAKREKEFNEQFFNTSLGYVRRTVTMKDGAVNSFLTDILPLLEVGVSILTYTKDLEQSKVAVTEEFLQECKQQLLADFYGK